MFNIFKKKNLKEKIDTSPANKDAILDVLNRHKPEADNLENGAFQEAYDYIEEKNNENVPNYVDAVQGCDLKKVIQTHNLDKYAQESDEAALEVEEFYADSDENIDFEEEIPEAQENLEFEEDFSQEEFGFAEEEIPEAQENLEFEEDFSQEEFGFAEEEIPEAQENLGFEEDFSQDELDFIEEEIPEAQENLEFEEDFSQDELDFIEEEIPEAQEDFGFEEDFSDVQGNFVINQEMPDTQENIEFEEDFSQDEEPVNAYGEEDFDLDSIPDTAPEAEKPKKIFGLSFSGLKEAIAKTSEFFGSNILSVATGKTEIDDDMLDLLEEKLIRADIGIDTTVYIVEGLREKKNKVKPDKLNEYLKEEFKQIIKAPGSNELVIYKNQLNTILVTGVNGAGKTTLIGKLANRYIKQGKKVLVAAGDTFRAAAEEQLEIWANRAGAEIVRQDGADPASVVFDAVKKAKNENYDILLIDTAGRLHNKFNLMEELRKIKKVIDKEAPNTLVESILVLDATTGQNGLKQAEVFKEAVDLSSVGLTKLDGTAKGGVIFGIAKQLKLPVKLIGVGEKMEDLKDFNAEDFVNALF